MSNYLNIDWAADAANLFGGQLESATIARKLLSSNNASDPSGPPNTTDQAWTADGVAVNYGERYVDQGKVRKGDHLVILLRGTVKTSPGAVAAPTWSPRPGDVVTIPPPGGGSAVASRVVAVRTLTPAHAVCEVVGPGA